MDNWVASWEIFWKGVANRMLRREREGSGYKSCFPRMLNASFCSFCFFLSVENHAWAFVCVY